MAESEYTGPLTDELFQSEPSFQTFEWTSTDSLEFAVTQALVESFDVDQKDFVLQESIDTDALAKLVGAQPGWTAPPDAFVSFRLESYDCTVLVDSAKRIQVWEF